jgi:hypothetical protein
MVFPSPVAISTKKILHTFLRKFIFCEGMEKLWHQDINRAFFRKVNFLSGIVIVSSDSTLYFGCCHHQYYSKVNCQILAARLVRGYETLCLSPYQGFFGQGRMVDGPSLSQLGRWDGKIAIEVGTLSDAHCMWILSLCFGTVKSFRPFYSEQLSRSLRLISHLFRLVFRPPQRGRLSGEMLRSKHDVVRSHCSGTTPSITQFRMRASSICKYLPDCITTTTRFSEEIKAFSTSLSSAALAVSTHLQTLSFWQVAESNRFFLKIDGASFSGFPTAAE